MEHLTSSPLFSVVPVAQSVGSVLCVVDHYLSFSTLSFDLFIVSVLILSVPDLVQEACRSHYI
jgi:hypothetical protein